MGESQPCPAAFFHPALHTLTYFSRIRPTFPNQFYGGRKNNSPTAWAIHGLTGECERSLPFSYLSLWPFLTVPLDDRFRIKDHAAASVSDEDFAQRAEKYPSDTPDTKEGYHIREIFHSV